MSQPDVAENIINNNTVNEEVDNSNIVDEEGDNNNIVDEEFDNNNIVEEEFTSSSSTTVHDENNYTWTIHRRNYDLTNQYQTWNSDDSWVHWDKTIGQHGGWCACNDYWQKHGKKWCCKTCFNIWFHEESLL